MNRLYLAGRKKEKLEDIKGVIRSRKQKYMAEKKDKGQTIIHIYKGN